MRIWFKLIAGLSAIAALLWILLSVGRFGLTLLRQSGGASGGHDPMFAVEETAAPVGEPVVQPEEFLTFEDNSANWDVSVQTPVDLTAEELAENARLEEADS